MLSAGLAATAAPIAVGEASADRGVTVGPATSPPMPTKTVFVPGTPATPPTAPGPTATPTAGPTEPAATEPSATPAPADSEPATAAPQPVPPVTDKQGDLAEDLRAADAAEKHSNLVWSDTHAEPCGTPHGAACPHNGFHGFRFGSYGRVAAATDLRGGTPEAVNVVARGPRIVEPTYLELDLSYGFISKRKQFIRPVMTLAFNDSLFHDNGEFKTGSAIRNLYVDAWGSLGSNSYNLWVGSRMYRGDDSYLFDEWPLDNQNTVGAGGKFVASRWNVAGHFGANRLLTPYQFQQIDVANPEQGATTALQLNRQRIVASLTGEATLIDGGPKGWSAKAKVHGEFASIGSGTRRRSDGTAEALPSDTGIRVGAQLGAWLPAHRNTPNEMSGFANLFMRYSAGLSAYDDLATPSSFGPDLRTFGAASELTMGVATGGNAGSGNVLVAAKARRFVDADVNSQDPDDGWEYVVDARPLVKVTDSFYAGADLSYQVRFPRGINPISQVASDPAVAQIAPMLVFAPMGGGALDRPQIRLVYRAAHLNQGARDLYVPDDIRHYNAWVHYLGVQAEWWFNAASGR